MKEKTKKIQKILDELMRTAPQPVERGDLCHRVNLQPYELTYLLRANPDQFKCVEVEIIDKNMILQMNIEAFVHRF